VAELWHDADAPLKALAATPQRVTALDSTKR
jgi:hypothetical protein